MYSFKRLVNAARHEDIDLIETELLELHSLAEKVNSSDLYKLWIEVLLRPLTTTYDFAENSSHHDGMLLVKSL